MSARARPEVDAPVTRREIEARFDAVETSLSSVVTEVRGIADKLSNLQVGSRLSFMDVLKLGLLTLGALGTPLALSVGAYFTRATKDDTHLLESRLLVLETELKVYERVWPPKTPSSP